MKNCPCGSTLTYTDCCNRFISGEEAASTPLELMRSRYTAYTDANIDYIARTMKPPAANNFNANEAREWATQVTWLKLEIVNATPPEQDKGFVEFRAHCSHHEQTHILHEKSEFHLIDGKWFYVDGMSPKISRNDSCPCGSQKKYKKCCGK